MKNKTYHLITYGCQMNKSDSYRIESFLNNLGLKKASLNKADFALLNLCSVRQSAIDRVWSKIHTTKKNNKKIKIILTGCILPTDKKKFGNKVDYVLDINELVNWPKEINKKQPTVNKNIKNKKDYFSIAPKNNSKHTAYIPIMTGCNNFCSYCVVPYVRGQEHSRAAKDILNEVNKFSVQGIKHIILLGQNVNSYYGDLSSKLQNPNDKPSSAKATAGGQIPNFKSQNSKSNKINFPQLLKLIDQVPGDFWISFMTSHPKDLSDGLIKCFKSCQHLMPHLHFAVQSGSNRILKKMNRKYTIGKYLKLVKQIRRVKPDINLSTDIIVGFPGETENDFQDTVKLMKQVKFDMAYINKYSPRAGTAAEKLKNDVPLIEKKHREKILTDILRKTALEKNKKMIGKATDVLIEKVGTGRDLSAFGKTKNYKNVKIKAINPPSPSLPAGKAMLRRAGNKQLTVNKDLISRFIKVKIIAAGPWGLAGKLIK